jgi:hypothetical protein
LTNLPLLFYTILQKNPHGHDAHTTFTRKSHVVR